MLTLAIQYPSFGPQHPPRLDAIAAAAPDPGTRVIAMEMFARDSDYQWAPVATGPAPWTRYTMMEVTSNEGRRDRRLRHIVFHALDEINPDVLVVNGWGHRESRHSLAWCRQRQRRIVLLSDSVRENRRRYWWKEYVKKWVIRGTAAGFVAGTPQARYLNYLGIPLSRIFFPGSCVVHNEYWRRETDRARNRPELRQQYGLPSRFFLCVARFIRCKNISFLVDAYARYVARAKHDPVALVLCGSGPEEGRILSRIEQNGLSTVHVSGFRQVDELPVYYAFADCLVVPSSSFECWALVVNEAMASGLPVLVSKQVGCSEDLVRSGSNGYVFDPRDVENLAEYLGRIAEGSALRTAMGAESRRIVDGHSPEVGARNLWLAVQSSLQ